MVRRQGAVTAMRLISPSKKENSRMKSVVIAAAVALGFVAAPAIAQTPPAAAAPAGKLSVEKSKISDIIKVPAAKAALEKTLPQISEYYEQIGEMTLKDVAPMSQGALNDDNLKLLQAEFDKLPS
jgi:hypothetical protein